MEDPYVTPKSVIEGEDPRVVELLVKYEQSLGVIQKLRSEGLSYDAAKLLVDVNAPAAQAQLDEQCKNWKYLAWFFAFTALLVIVIPTENHNINLFLRGAIAILMLLSAHFFGRCKKLYY